MEQDYRSRCLWCAEVMVWEDEGWTHEGGTLYRKKCTHPDCKWEGWEPPHDPNEWPKCPQCERIGFLVDHHGGVPVAASTRAQMKRQVTA
jgi:hypothetical protein